MNKLPNGRKILFLRQNQITDFEGMDEFDVAEMLDPATYHWAAVAKNIKQFHNKKAKKDWWDSLAVDTRKRFRVEFAAIMNHAPKGLDRQALADWWESIGKDKREELRDKYDGDDILDTIQNIAKKGIDIITLTPIVSKIPVLGKIHKEIHGATTKLNMLPFKATEDLIKGRRVDKIAIEQFKESLSAAKTLAPYVQTVISFVPGIGTGLSAGLGGALALASGKSIDEAMLEAVKSALPGGALAGAVFDVTVAVIQKKPIDEVLVNAIPVSDSQKKALITGTKAVRALAEGKKVDQVLIDSALTALPENLQKAAKIGVALAEASNIQKTSSKKKNSFKPIVKAVSTSTTMSESIKSIKDAIKKAPTKEPFKSTSIKIIDKPMVTVTPPDIIQNTSKSIKKLEDVLSILKDRQIRRLATHEHNTIVKNDKTFSNLLSNQTKTLDRLAKIEAKLNSVKIKNNNLLASLI